MAKRLHFNKPNRINKLHDELLAAIAALRGPQQPDGSRLAVMTVESSGDDIWLTVPDDADETAIQAVIDAHTNAAPPPSQDEIDIEEIREILTGPGNLTQAQIKKGFRLLFKFALASQKA
jgi:hypothetical protein